MSAHHNTPPQCVLMTGNSYFLELSVHTIVIKSHQTGPIIREMKFEMLPLFLDSGSCLLLSLGLLTLTPNCFTICPSQL